MKKTLLIPVLILVSIISHSQFIHKIKADSVLITNDSCNAELNLENSTKNVNGFLYNKGKGRTEFRKGLITINDSLYIIGDDTLNIAKGSGNYIRNQNVAPQTADYNISGIATSNQVWTNMLFHNSGRSGIRFSRFNNTYEEHFFNNNFNRSISFVELFDVAYLQALTDAGTPWKRLVLSVYPTGHIDFQPSTALNKTIRFNKNGNVNIGDSTDLGYKLQVNGKSLFRDTIRSITPLISNATGYDMIVRRRTDSAFYRLPFDSIVGSSSYTLPVASPTVLGGIKVGANLSIDAGGVLSASGGSGMAIGGTITGSPNEKSLLFVGAGGVLAQNTNLIFDSTNKYLGINMGSVAPSDFLQVGGTTGSIQFGGANGRTITARNAANDGYSNFDFIANSVSFDSKLEVLSVGGVSGKIELYEGTAGTATDGALEHITDNLNFTSGTTRYIIPKTLVASATLDFPNTTSNNVADLTITVTGAALGDAVSLGIPNASVTPTATFSAWVSAANTVKIRFSPKATENPASGTFKVSVIK